MWHRYVSMNYFCVMKHTDLLRISSIINTDCCCLVNCILNTLSYSVTCWECCSDSCFDCIVLHFTGSNWEKGTKSKTLSFSSWGESCPKECSTGSGHDEERYEFIQQSRRKDPFVYFLTGPCLDLYCNIFCIPRGFPRSLPREITFFLCLYILYHYSNDYFNAIAF